MAHSTSIPIAANSSISISGPSPVHPASSPSITPNNFQKPIPKTGAANSPSSPSTQTTTSLPSAPSSKNVVGQTSPISPPAAPTKFFAATASAHFLQPSLSPATVASTGAATLLTSISNLPSPRNPVTLTLTSHFSADASKPQQAHQNKSVPRIKIDSILLWGDSLVTHPFSPPNLLANIP